jgi:hypothetical protein
MFVAGTVFSQDTLPKFTIIERGQKVVISWINPYPTITTLNVQWSYDSIKNFSTVYSAPSPTLPQNGYSDVKKQGNRVFYRLFYVLEGGAYFFTKSKRATADESGTATTTTNLPAGRDFTGGTFNNIIPGDKRVVSVQIKDAFYKQFSINSFRNFKDSILRLTRDTIYLVSETQVRIQPYVVREDFKASQYIFANPEGYINISLPQISQKKYRVKFFEENGSSLFEIANVKESPLILDKSSFIHAGWFLFELYEDNKLKEKNRFYLPKDF